MSVLFLLNENTFGKRTIVEKASLYDTRIENKEDAETSYTCYKEICRVNENHYEIIFEFTSDEMQESGEDLSQLEWDLEHVIKIQKIKV